MNPLTKIYKTEVQQPAAQIVGIDREYSELDGAANPSVRVFVECDEDGGIMSVDIIVFEGMHPPLKGDWVLFEGDQPIGYVDSESFKNNYRAVATRKPRAKKEEQKSIFNDEKTEAA